MKKLMTLLASLMVFCSFAWSQDNVTVNVKLPRGVKITWANTSDVVKNADGSWTITYEGSYGYYSIELSKEDKYVYLIDGTDAEGGKFRTADSFQSQYFYLYKQLKGECNVEICLEKDMIYFHEDSYDFAVEAGENVYNQTSPSLGRFVKKGADVKLKNAPNEGNDSRSFYYLDGNDNEWKPFSRKDLEDGKELKNVQNLVSGYLVRSDVSLISDKPDSLFNITPKNVSNNKVGDEHQFTYLYRGTHNFYVGTDFPGSVKPVYMLGSPQGENDRMLSGNSTEEVYGGDIVLYQKADDPTYFRIDLPKGLWGSPLCHVYSRSQEESPVVLSFYGPSNPYIPEFYYVRVGAEVSFQLEVDAFSSAVYQNITINDASISYESDKTEIIGPTTVEMTIETDNAQTYADFVGCHNVSVEYTGQIIDGWIVEEYDDYYDIYGYVGTEPDDYDDVTVPLKLGNDDGKPVSGFHLKGFNGTKIETLRFTTDESGNSVWFDDETYNLRNIGDLKTVYAATYNMYTDFLYPLESDYAGEAIYHFGNAKIVLDPNNTETINDLILYPDGNEDSNSIPTYTLIGVADNAGLVVRRPVKYTDAEDSSKKYKISSVGPMQANDNVLCFGLIEEEVLEGTANNSVNYFDANFIQMTSLRGLCAGGTGNGMFQPNRGVNIGEKVDLFGTSDGAFDVSIFEALDNISKVEDAGVEYDKENDILTAKVSNNTNFEDIATFVNSGISLAENINISLVEDIDLTESATPQTWSQLGTSENPFTGIFDGAGHSLNVGEIAGSLFGTIGNAAELGDEDPTFGIKDLSVIISEAAADVKQGVDSDDMLEKYFGLLAQNNYGTISNVIASGLIYLTNDEDARNAVATLIANNEGVMDHVVGFFGTEEETANKASIIVIQNMGRGRTKGRVSKSASNGKAKGNATISYEPNEAEIKLNYRLYTDEEFASGEPAYWLNFDGEGYSGNFNGEWAKGSKHPVKAVADGQGAAVRISYEVEGREENEVNVKGAFFANDKTGLKLDYDIKPDAIKINGSVVDSDPASGSAVVSLASGARNNKGEMVITLHYNATGVKDIEADKKASAVKTIENGRVVIIRDGKKYDLAGRVVE